MGVINLIDLEAQGLPRHARRKDMARHIRAYNLGSIEKMPYLVSYTQYTLYLGIIMSHPRSHNKIYHDVYDSYLRDIIFLLRLPETECI